MQIVPIDRSGSQVVLALIAHHIQGHKIGKVNQTPIAKVMYAQTLIQQSNHISMTLMVDVNNAQVDLSQVNLILPMDSELNVLPEVVMLAHAQDAFNTEMAPDNAKPVLETKLLTSTKTDVLSDQIAKLVNSITHVTNAKIVLLELHIMLLPDLALLLKLTEIVLVTLNGMLVLTNA
jgi:hypothetical protein